MKTLPVFAFLLALGAFVFFPVSFEIGGSLLVAGGIVAIAFSDYSRRTRVLALPAVAGAAVAARRSEKFGLAA